MSFLRLIIATFSALLTSMIVVITTVEYGLVPYEATISSAFPPTGPPPPVPGVAPNTSYNWEPFSAVQTTNELFAAATQYCTPTAQPIAPPEPLLLDALKEIGSQISEILLLFTLNLNQYINRHPFITKLPVKVLLKPMPWYHARLCLQWLIFVWCVLCLFGLPLWFIPSSPRYVYGSTQTQSQPRYLDREVQIKDREVQTEDLEAQKVDREVQTESVQLQILNRTVTALLSQLVRTATLERLAAEVSGLQQRLAEEQQNSEVFAQNTKVQHERALQDLNVANLVKAQENSNLQRELLDLRITHSRQLEEVKSAASAKESERKRLTNNLAAANQTIANLRRQQQPVHPQTVTPGTIPTTIPPPSPLPALPPTTNTIRHPLCYHKLVLPQFGPSYGWNLRPAQLKAVREFEAQQCAPITPRELLEFRGRYPSNDGR